MLNLKNSFPNKNDKELKQIARKFYTHLTDTIFESIKGYTIPLEKLKKRYQLTNPELIDKYYYQNKDIITASGHYGNWEWGTQVLPSLIKHDSKILYKPLSNKSIDSHIKKNRAKYRGDLINIKFTRRIFSNEKHKPITAVMLGDQSPANKKKAIWVNFLNQDTACIHGIEFYAIFFKTPVIYFDIKKIKRGYYKIYLELLSENPQDLPKEELTKLYMKRLEKTIIEKPEYYLWSHKRWKHKRT